MGFVDGMGGVVTELRFTDEMLQSLADLSLAEDCNAVSVNQATLSIYVEHADYDYTKIDPSVITPVLNGAQTRLGMYTDYKNLSPVADYMYANESTYTIPYGGYLNRSLACYTMDISNFIQSLALACADNLAQDGRTVDFDKIDEKYRRIYLCPRGVRAVRLRPCGGNRRRRRGRRREKRRTRQVGYDLHGLQIETKYVE